jgi:GT2 family glycosyltransferase
VNAAAVVVRWRGGDEVDRCLSSLLRHGGERLAQIVLVDSGSGDGGAERLAAKFPDVKVIALDTNLSFAHAANCGVAAVAEDLVFLLNPDTEIGEGCVSTLVAALERRPRAAGVVPLLINPDGSGQHRWQLRRLPTFGDLATGRPGAPAFSQPPTSEITVEQPAAAAWMIRREIWQALHGFDESFAPAWWEDVDFCARLAAGLDDPSFPADEGFVAVPDARVFHAGGSSVGELTDADFLKRFHTNLIQYASRHHPTRWTSIRFRLRCSLLGKAVLRPSRSRAFLEAWRELGQPSAV